MNAFSHLSPGLQLQSQGDARSMADYLAQANANLEGRVEEMFKMMQEIMGSEQGVTDLELLSVMRSLREENVRLLKERQQVPPHPPSPSSPFPPSSSFMS